MKKLITIILVFISLEVSIDPGTIGISSFIIGRVFRSDTGADDTWATNTAGNRPILLGVDFHYEVDSPGSKSSSTK